MQGRKCEADELCLQANVSQWVGPNDGITTFDDIYLSMLTIFQCITLEGWSEIYWLTRDCMDHKYGYVSTIVFYILVLVGSFFMLNLVLGVLSGEFAKERERVENRKSYRKKIKQHQIDLQVDGYTKWILRGEADLSDEEEEEDDEVEVKKCHNFRKLQRDFRRKVRAMIKSKAFYWVVLLLLFLNTMSMAFNAADLPEDQTKITNILKILENTFTILFFVEMCLLMYALGIRGYFRRPFNGYDFVIVWASIGDMIFHKLTKQKTLGFSVFRSLRLLKIFKVTRFWNSMQKEIGSLMKSMRSILSLILLLCVFLIIFAMLGMELFGGMFQDLLTNPRSNFDTFTNAVLTVFQIIVGEDWNTVMHNGIRASGGPKSIYGKLVSLFFVILVIGGNYTLLNVFLAIAVDNLASAHVQAKFEQNQKKILLKKEEDALKKAEAKAVEQKQQEALEAQQAKGASLPTPELNKQSKWNVVRSVPKVLMLAKRNEDEENENPFKGITYKGRPERTPPPAIRTLSDCTGAVMSHSDRFHKAVLAAQVKYSSFDMQDGVNDTSERKPSTVSTATTPPKTLTPKPKMLVNKLHPKLSGDTETTAEPPVTVNANAEIDDKWLEPALSNYSPMNLLPIPGLVGDMRAQTNSGKRVIRRRPLATAKVINTRTLFIFSPSSRIRAFCHKVVNLQYFEQTMLFFILVSSVILVIDPRTSRHHDGCKVKGKNNELFEKVINSADIIFVIIFFFEIMIKVIDQGLFINKGSYLRDWWNLFDTCVVCCNIACAVFIAFSSIDDSCLGEDKDSASPSKVTSILQVLRVLRVLRMLRLVNKINGLKIVCKCVVFSVRKVINMVVIFALCLFMFAVIGVHLFQGRFHYCTDQSKLTEAECHGTYYKYKNTMDPSVFTVEKREWRNRRLNFDSVNNSTLTLFSFATGEGWPVVMQWSIDSTERNEGPIPENSMVMCIYYILFVVLFSFFFLNTFVALIIVTFQEQGEKELTGCVLDKNQRACMQFVLNAKPRQRFMPHNKDGFSFKVWKIVDSKPFEVVIMILISMNAISLALKTYDQNTAYTDILEKINMVFTIIFTIEAILKLIGYNLNYFRDSWNVFDFIIVFVTLVGVILKHVEADIPIEPSIFRLFRVFRLLKLLRQGYNIRILLWTFMQSLRALPYVVLLIIIVFFIYAVIGHSQFGDIAFNKSKGFTQPNTEYNNFDDVLTSLMVLFRCGTGEAWHLVMLDCFDDAPCKYNPSKKCGNTTFAEFYFISFYLLYAFLMLNLFVAVIMDNFDYLTRDESILGPQHMDEFVRVWSDYDPSASGRIAHEDIYQLMCDMQPPVGFGKKCPRFLAYKRLMKLNMPISGDNTVSFTPSIFALVRTSLRLTHHENEHFRDCNFRKIIKRIWPNTTQKTLDMMMPEQTVLSGQQITIGKIYAAKLIYESFKEIKRRKNCTLPQFDMFEATHKRGNSFFRKMMGVLRTSSQPGLANEKAPPLRTREGLIPNHLQDVVPRRRRSNTATCDSPTIPHPGNSLNRNSTPARIRSASSSLIIPVPKTFAAKRKSTLPYLSSSNIIPNTAAVPQVEESSESEEEAPPPTPAPTPTPENNQVQACNDDQTNNSLTNSLITALRDPAKPILCFVNPQIHQDAPRTLNTEGTEQETTHDNTNNNSTSTLERRPSNPRSRQKSPRSRQKRVTVSLPMIQLEIPVERDGEFMEFCNRVTTPPTVEQNNNDNEGNDVPDIIKSVQKSSSSTSKCGHHSRTSSDALSESEPSDNVRSDSESESQSNQNGGAQGDESSTNNHNSSNNNNNNNTSNTNCELLRELNNQIDKAISEGAHPRWIYQIQETEEDTWC